MDSALLPGQLFNISVTYMAPLITAITSILSATNVMEDIVASHDKSMATEVEIFDFVVGKQKT